MGIRHNDVLVIIVSIANGVQTLFPILLTLKYFDSLIEFDEDVWLQAIEVVKIKNDGAMIFTFQGDPEIEV